MLLSGQITNTRGGLSYTCTSHLENPSHITDHPSRPYGSITVPLHWSSANQGSASRTIRQLFYTAAQGKSFVFVPKAKKSVIFLTFNTFHSIVNLLVTNCNRQILWFQLNKNKRPAQIRTILVIEMIFFSARLGNAVKRVKHSGLRDHRTPWREMQETFQ